MEHARDVIDEAVSGDRVDRTAMLFDWSTNCESPTPASLFMDLIGFSEDEFGYTLTQGKIPQMGYVEVSKLGEALVEWSDRPLDVERFIRRLLDADE